MTRQLEEPGRVYVPAARRPANRSGLKLVDAGCKTALTRAAIEAINAAGHALRANLIRVDCETCRGHGDVHMGFGKFAPCHDCAGEGSFEVDADEVCDATLPRLRNAGAL